MRKRESNQQAAKLRVVQAPAQKREAVIVIMVSYSISDMLQMIFRISDTLTPTPKLNTVYPVLALIQCVIVIT